MPRLSRLVTRRMGPVGLALTAWDVYRRLPPRQRQWVLQQARRHGTTVAQQIVASRRRPPR